MRQGLWGIVSGRSKRPIPADSKATTAAEAALIDAWDKNAEKAAGELYLLVSEEQKVHFAGICWNEPVHNRDWSVGACTCATLTLLPTATS